MGSRSERWRPVPGWEWAYEVSTDGRVRSVDRTVPWGRHGRTTYRGRIIKGHPATNQPYPVVAFTKPSARVTFFIHDLVLLAFVGPKPAGLEVCHQNDIPTDNRLRNLRYDTRSANAKEGIRNRQKRKAK